MADPAIQPALPTIDIARKDDAGQRSGVLPSQALRDAIASREIRALQPIADAQIQPASIDLRLGDIAYRMPASFLPGRRHTVMERIDAFAMHALSLEGGAVLERGCVYIVPLLEAVALKRRTSALANPKSSTGRLDVFARVITDHGTEFDRIPERYAGPLFVEISPRTFSILVRPGSRLVQLRVRRGSPPTGDAPLKRLHDREALVRSADLPDIRDAGIAVTVDVEGDPETGFVGYKARKHADLVDLDKVDHYDPAEYWDPVYRRRGRGIILDPDDFYILASREAVTVPPDHAAEMVAYDTLIGEFRVHYAGFFDPGFGHAEGGADGTRAVLEVRSHEVPFMIDEGQVVGRLMYERLTERPDRIYGAGIGSSYQRQGLTLAKQFRRP